MSDLAATAASYTVRDLFQRAFGIFGPRIAVTAEQGQWTYAELGLVNAVLPEPGAALQHALTLAAQLAAGHRPAIAQAKTLLNASTGGSRSDSLELAAGIQAALLRSEPVRRSFADFLARRDG